MNAPKSFYNFNRLNSFNAIYNLAVGGRGIGKTYGMQKQMIKQAIRTHEQYGPGMCDQFIYLRRYKDELKLSKDTFFAAVQNEFPDWDFRVNGFHAEMSPASERETKKRPWWEIGYFIELSRSQQYKSVAFPRVKTICFDEFILEKSHIHYLPNEAEVFNNFFSTVDRYKDKTRVYFLANSVRIENPYFVEYGVDPDKANPDGFLKLSGGFMVVHFIEASQFAAEVYNTKFGQFIQGTDYAKYAVGNEFADNHKSLIAEKDARARYLFSLELASTTVSVWYNIVTGQYFVQKRRPKVENIITIYPELMGETKTLMRISDPLIAKLRSAFQRDRMRFKEPASRNAFMEIFKK
jgi:hypothetical protein